MNDSILDLDTLDAHDRLGAESGNGALLDQLIRALLASLDAHSESFRLGLAERDWRRAALAVHTVKGAAGALGAQRLARQCEQIESALRSGRHAGAGDWAAHVEREVDAARQAIRSFAASRR